MAERSPILPAHVEDTVQSIAKLHARHDRETKALQRLVDRTTAWVGRPFSLGLLTLLILGWVAGNLLVSWSGRQPWDPPPFSWLIGGVSIVALYTTILILTTQRHDDELAEHREQLTLELAILSEQKSAKIIQLLEQMRSDSPHLSNHDDAEAQAMTTPADPQSVLDALQNTSET